MLLTAPKELNRPKKQITENNDKDKGKAIMSTIKS